MNVNKYAVVNVSCIIQMKTQPLWQCSSGMVNIFIIFSVGDTMHTHILTADNVNFKDILVRT